MLYQLHEAQRAMALPLRFAAEANQHLFRHPLNPMSYTPQGRALAAASELVHSQLQAHVKPAFGLAHTTIDGNAVAVRERVVLDTPFCQLLHFQRETAPAQPRVLMVAPMSGHFATLLRGTVEALLPHADIYITDWRDARDVRLSAGPFDLDDYVDLIIRFLRHLGPNTHTVAVCQPSVPVLAAAALMNADGDNCAPASMTLMGGPIDTRHNPTTPNKLAKSRSLDWFERSVISRVPVMYPGFMRAVYPGFLQLGGFMSMNLDRHVSAHVRHYFHLVRGDGDSAAAHRAFYEEYRAVMDLPAEYYLQTIERVFQQHQLAAGTFRHRGRLVDPAAITRTALMTVEGGRDDISGVGQTKAAHNLLKDLPANLHRHYEQPDVGHYGVFNGRRWREQIAPRVVEFLTAHDDA
ncbi:MAG: polyhydroxyalkanoate depolymerase [Alphaproteobacteria bacterium]